MKQPTVSVCIAAYNHGNYIRDCVMSVISQSMDESIEIIIGEDCSEDETAAIVSEIAAMYPNIINYIQNSVRLGPCGNYKNIMRLARGKYIAYLDGDDYWLPGKLSAQIAFMDSHKECSAVYTNALCMNNDGELIGIFNNRLRETYDLRALLRDGNFLNHSSMLYRSQFRNEITSWERDFIDYKIHLYFASHGPIGYINSCGVVYRVSSTTSMIANYGDYIRSLYFDAIQSLDDTNITQKDVFYSVSDYLRRTFFKALKAKSPYLFLERWKDAASLYHSHKTRLIVLTVVNITVSLYRELRGYCAAKLGRTGLRVIYWR